MPDFLKNFIRGAGSILDILPAQQTRFDPNVRFRTSEEAIRSDWQHVGTDLKNAMSAATPQNTTHGSAQQSK